MEARYVQGITLATEVDKRVAFATVQFGGVVIRGVMVWRSRNGSLRVYFPSCRIGYGLEDAVTLPAELRTEIEAEVISAYKEAKAKAAELENLKHKPPSVALSAQFPRKQVSRS